MVDSFRSAIKVASEKGGSLVETSVMAPLPAFLTVSQFATACGVSYGVARNWIVAGKVEARTFPRRQNTTYRVPRQQAQAIMDRRNQGLPV